MSLKRLYRFGDATSRAPELGCFAWGETIEEVAHEVQDSISAHLEALRELGRPIPEPRVVA